MTKDEIKAQMLQLVTALREGLTQNKEWDDISDWSKKLKLSDKVFISFSPGDATSLIVTFADKGVVPLAPEGFDDPEYELPESQINRPHAQTSSMIMRTKRLIEAVNIFEAWSYNGRTLKSVELQTCKLTRVENPGNDYYSITLAVKKEKV